MAKQHFVKKGGKWTTWMGADTLWFEQRDIDILIMLHHKFKPAPGQTLCDLRAYARYITHKHRAKWTPQRCIKRARPLTDTSGYFVVSGKHNIVARIDRPDWREFMAKEHSPWSLVDGFAWAMSAGAADHYRRCYSQDKMEVAADHRQLYAPSGDHDHPVYSKYVEIDGD